MRKSVLLGLGGALAMGGYALKRYLDGKIAASDYSGYAEAAACEGGKAFVRGFNKLSEKAEGWFDEPQFYGGLDESADRFRVLSLKHSRLNGEPLCPKLYKKERFAFAKLARERYLQSFDYGDEAVSERCDEFEGRANEFEKLIDAIYKLEENCYEAHLALKGLGEQFKRLENFAPNTPILPLQNFSTAIVGVMYAPPAATSICERISRYRCEPSRFDLAGFDEGSMTQINELTLFIAEQGELVRGKGAFLKSLIAEQTDFEKFSEAQQRLFLQLATLAECLQTLINASFVEFEDGVGVRYKDAQRLIDEVYKDTPRSLEMSDLDELKEGSAVLNESVSSFKQNARKFDARVRGILKESGENSATFAENSAKNSAEGTNLKAKNAENSANLAGNSAKNSADGVNLKAKNAENSAKSVNLNAKNGKNANKKHKNHGFKKAENSED